MQLEITLEGKDGKILLPRQYNEVLQGFLYRNLESELALKLHDDGFTDPKSIKRRLKLFTFSRVLGKWKEEGEMMAFDGPVCWFVASPWEELLSSLAMSFLCAAELELYNQKVRVAGLKVIPIPEYKRPVRVVTLSPITVYRTLLTPEGRRKTYYYSPFEKEFSDLVVGNLVRKVRAFQGQEVPKEGEVRPVRVRKQNEHVILYKGTVVKAWSGVYELDLPEPLFRMAFAAGLGAKNSQGFGCIGLWSPTAPERRKT